jgi:hypothetical protein
MLTTSSMAAAASLASVVVANGLPTTAVETTLAQPNSSFKKLDCTAATEEAAAGQGAARSVGDEEDLLPKKKRAKTSHEWVQTVLRQTAEMVMVLAGMGALRAGLSPTPLECKLATEAYEKLASLVENIAPLQLVSKDAVSSLIQQLRVDVAPVAPQQPKTLKPFVIVSPTYCLPSLVFPFKGSKSVHSSLYSAHLMVSACQKVAGVPASIYPEGFISEEICSLGFCAL